MDDIKPEQINSVSADGIITYTLPSQTATMSLADLQQAQLNDQQKAQTYKEGLSTIESAIAARQIIIDAAIAKQV